MTRARQARWSATAALVAMTGFAGSANALQLQVTIENLAPVNGNFLTPVWVGFHGGYDLFNPGELASPGIEALAEDGNTAPLAAAFTASGLGSAQGVVAGANGPLAPGDVASAVFKIDPNDPNSQFFSFAAMILPSNDAFIANADATGFQIFDENGNFVGADFFIMGNDVYDAGTEFNDELPENTAFFGQAAPNTGVTTADGIALHPGFLPAGSGGILDAAQFANADFLRPGYPIAQITITAVPLPGAALFMLSALGGLVGFLRRR